MIRGLFCSLAFGLLAAPLACGSSSSDASEDGGIPKPTKTCAADSECAVGSEICDLQQKGCIAFPAGGEVGYRDGTATSVAFAEIYSTDAKTGLIDLAFHHTDKTQIFAIGYEDSYIHVGQGIGSDKPTWKKIHDPAAMHFMYKPPGIAMGDNGFWGTCGNNDNAQANRFPNYFMGPALFTTDLQILGTRPTGLGSHYDMLHNTPFCRGIAHVEANIYWVFNSYDKSLDKYDFHKDHGPGNDDHSDGEIYRYAAGQVLGVDETPSHVIYDPSDKFLYVADTGNKRIVKLDTTKGTNGGPLPRKNEKLAGSGVMDGTQVEEVVAPGTLEKPSGIEVKGELLYVTDTATSTFHVFDKTGKPVRKLATELPAGSLAGFVFGPDGKIWFTDRLAGKIRRIDPR
jgi:hypothetical protein